MRSRVTPATDFPPALLARVEDAGLNASAPPQQRWMDGWLVRFSPGKAKRARCINAVAPGVRLLADKLAASAALYQAQSLPWIFRITPFTQPADLDAQLAARGFVAEDDTRVMVCTDLAQAIAQAAAAPQPAVDMSWREIDPADYGPIVGAWRGTPPEGVRAHVERLRTTPVPYRAWIGCDATGELLAGGQTATEDGLVGLYDIFTAPAARGQGLATALCGALLAAAREGGAEAAYLQVDADNLAARRIYQRLGFADAYAYHYRTDTHAGG
ncbi:GNAT family N-acetyltransferase [Ideonella sp. DXS22W]|uniref:GNAT family N-acetyltransferase n=1 Tax=Pseudaquabacterium inlustre TaxID=2984192 RepID=A0ABU9CIZ2_9BURK